MDKELEFFFFLQLQVGELDSTNTHFKQEDIIDIKTFWQSKNFKSFPFLKVFKKTRWYLWMKLKDSYIGGLDWIKF